MDNGYDCSINKYKKVEYVPVDYSPTDKTLKELDKLEEEIIVRLAGLWRIL